jgi:hypothetical protein
MNLKLNPSARSSGGSVLTLVTAFLALSAVSAVTSFSAHAALAVQPQSGYGTFPGSSSGTSASSGAISDEQAMIAIRASLSNPAKFVWGFEAGGWRALSLKVLDLMVQEGMTNLQTVGEIDLSQQLQKEWQNVYGDALAATQSGESQGGTFNTLDLGDHAPLFQWLTNYVDVLNQKTRGIVGKLQLISDLMTLNYAIPVVFHPSGEWKASTTNKDWVEYRLHFIPFANIISYWGALEGCKYGVKRSGISILGQLCEPISGKIEHVMGRYIAPRMSDYVFVDANPGTDIDDSGPTKPKKPKGDTLPSVQEILQQLKDDNGGAL